MFPALIQRLRQIVREKQLTHLHLPNMERIALGAANIGGLFLSGKPSIGNAIEMLSAAFGLGINLIDTGFYGNNAAENFIGRALEEMAAAGRFTPGALHIQAKVGRPIVPALARYKSSEQVPWTLPGAFAHCADIWDFSDDGLARHIAGCMQRMQPETLGTIALHDPDQALDLGKLKSVKELEPAVKLLCELRSERFCKQIAVAGKSVDGLCAIINAFPGVFDVVQTTCYGLHMHAECLEKLMPLCAEQGAALHMAGPFGGNICSATDPRKPHPDGFAWASNYAKASEEKIAQVGAIFDIAAQHGWDHLRHLCMWFCYLNPQVRKIVLGANTSEQLIENVAWLFVPPPADLITRLKETDFQGSKLIDPKAPTCEVESVPVADLLGAW